MSYYNFTQSFGASLSNGKVKRSKKEVNKIVDDVKARLVKLEDRDYWIVGYGSILNERSRAKTLPNEIKSVPAYIQGFERIFNLDCRTQTVLNVQPTKSTKTKLNVVATKIPYKDMFDFILRERNYDIVEVPVYDKKGGLIVANAVMVIATDTKQLGDQWPNMKYVQANIYGAFELGGEKFVDEYLNTTFFYGFEGEKLPLSEYITPFMVSHCMDVDSSY